jgi:hypothetical protein
MVGAAKCVRFSASSSIVRACGTGDEGPSC